jgi:hypothetical protein
MTHVMLDIETWGGSPDGVIISVGAVAFDISTGRPVERYLGLARNEAGEEVPYTHPATFSVAVDARDAQRMGMQIDADTVYWWFRQSQDAINSWLQAERLPLADAMLRFYSWYEQHRPKAVWANAPTFDCAIVRTACKLCGFDAPWHYKVERCVRTYVAAARMAGYPKQARAEVEESEAAGRGTKHDAVADCMHQIKYVHEVWKFLQKASPGNVVNDLLTSREEFKRFAKEAQHRVRWLLRFMHSNGIIIDDGFAFPDGETWFPLGEDES